MMRVNWWNREWVCLPERALWWPAQAALICADLHAGKDEAFRRAGVPMPEGALSDDLARLSAALARVPARMLIILGDFFHARSGRGPRVLAALSEWRARHAEVEVLLVRGNHDLAAGDPPRALGIRVLRGYSLDGISLQHVPLHPAKCIKQPFVAGHLHPVARLSAGRESVTLPCFWFRQRGLVLPAFSGLAGGFRIRPARADLTVLIGPDGKLMSGHSPVFL